MSLCYRPPTMPRGPRLDAPDTLHHVMVRGIEGRATFHDDQDRDDFLSRLGAVARTTDLTLYAWALVPNHLHLLVRTGVTPLARVMRALLTGYAGAFNRRHRRRDPAGAAAGPPGRGPRPESRGVGGGASPPARARALRGG
jgi:hypothetical protein